MPQEKTSEAKQSSEVLEGLEWLICRDPVHIGGSDSDSRGNRNPIFRLPDRTPAIPGSSLRGALRERAENDQDYEKEVIGWFGSKNSDLNEDEDSLEDKLKPGSIALGWGWPVWWPVHVLGYGNWWVTCPSWLNRIQQLCQQPPLRLNRKKIYITEKSLNNKDVYLRWLKLTKVEYYDKHLPAPEAKEEDSLDFDLPKERRIIVPDDSINLIVEMGMVRQPRVSLRSREEMLALDEETDNESNGEQNDKKEKSMVKNLFSVEGLPPGTVFLFAWTTRANFDEKDAKTNKSEGTEKQTETGDSVSETNSRIQNPKSKIQNLKNWETFLRREHYLGGLWGIGYGRVSIQSATSDLQPKQEGKRKGDSQTETLTATQKQQEEAVTSKPIPEKIIESKEVEKPNPRTPSEQSKNRQLLKPPQRPQDIK